MIRQTVEEAGLESIAMPAMVRLFERSSAAGLAGPDGTGHAVVGDAVAAMVDAFVGDGHQEPS